MVVMESLYFLAMDHAYMLVTFLGSVVCVTAYILYSFISPKFSVYGVGVYMSCLAGSIVAFVTLLSIFAFVVGLQFA